MAGPPLPQIQQILERHRAVERIRQNQQGLGRPIISGNLHGHQIVAVRNTVHWSPTWKTFPDFLADYIKRVLGADWGNAEIAKPFEQRHPLLRWYDTYCRYQQATIVKPGEINDAPITGIVACYLGLAYSLYLLDHNVELQDRLVQRLKDAGQFQGAYYELMVANILVRAGFTLTLEDETDGASAHILVHPLTPEELADYRANREAYFGRIQPVGRKITGRKEFFDWLMETNAHLSREELLNRLAAEPEIETLRSGTDDELRAAYCEDMVAAFEASGFKTGEGP